MTLKESNLDKPVQLLCWIFTLSFVAITFLPRSLDDTMFMDGVTYASISRNMAAGIGSFWRPFFAHSFWLPYDNGPYFSGHPPLMFGMQSLLFRIMADTNAVENVHNVIVLVISILLIVKIWGKLYEETPHLRPFSWLSILCWYAMVTVYYSMPNNFLDSTMGIFCLLSCYFQLIFLKKQQVNYMWPILAGANIFLAFLTKGPVGLYPLGFTLLYTVCLGRRRDYLSALRTTSVIAATFAVSLGAILAYEPANEFLTTYFNGQVIQVILQKRENTAGDLAGHLYLIQELMRNIFPHLMAFIGLTLVAIVCRLKSSISRDVLIISFFALIVGLSGILPMLISSKQYPHYLLPALPFIAIFTAAMLVEKTGELMVRMKPYTIGILFIGTFVCWVITIKKVNASENDVMVLNAKQLRRYVAKGSTIGICHDLYQNADIHANFQRYHQLSLTTNTDSVKYSLINTDCIAQFDPAKYAIVELRGGYSLAIKKAEKQAETEAAAIF